MYLQQMLKAATSYGMPETFKEDILNDKHPSIRYKKCMWCGGFDFISRRPYKESLKNYLNVCSIDCLDWYAHSYFGYDKPKTVVIRGINNRD